MAKQHVCCWRVSGPKADIAKSTRLTLSGQSLELGAVAVLSLKSQGA